VVFPLGPELDRGPALVLADLKAWIVSVGVAPAQEVSEAEQPDRGDARNLTVRDTSGLGLTTGGAFDRPTFQALSRGPVPGGAGGATGPEAQGLAYRLDRAILDAERPFDVGGGETRRRVVDCGRIGGGPGYLGVDDRGRAEYSCNYWMEIER